jgi:WD40 repeat protein
MRFLKGHHGFAQTVAFAPDGATLATGGRDGTIRLWNLQSGEQCGQYQQDGPVSTLTFAPGGGWLASGGHDRRVHLWNRLNGREQLLKGFRGSEVFALAFAPPGLRLPGDQQEQLAWGRQDGVVGVWPIGSGKGSEVLRHGGTVVLTLAFAPDGRTLAVGGQSDFVQLWDVTSERLVRSLEVGDAPCCRCLAFSPNGRLLAAALVKGPVVWKVAGGGGQVEHIPARPRCVASGLAFSPDGGQLLVGGWDGVVALHDLSGGVLREGRGWHWGMERVFGVAVSPDGMLAAAVGDGPNPVVLWDLD